MSGLSPLDVLEPLGSDVYILPDPAPTLFAAGIVAVAPLSRPRSGVIAKAGPDAPLPEDTQVFHRPYAGKDISLDGQRLVHLTGRGLIGFQELTMQNEVIEGRFVPLWDNLLVRDDEKSLELFHGLVRPGTAEGGRAISGVVVRCGDEVHEDFRPGTRVVYGVQDGCDVSRAGLVKEDKGYRVLSQMAILARLDGEEDPDDVLGEGWKPHLVPVPGTLLVERAAQPLTRGLIEVPNRLYAATRSSECLVVAVSPGLAEELFAVGERLFLSGSVSRNIPLGVREDVVLWALRPGEVTGRVLVDPGKVLDVEDHVHLDVADELARTARDTAAFEEGDRRAPR